MSRTQHANAQPSRPDSRRGPRVPTGGFGRKAVQQPAIEGGKLALALVPKDRHSQQHDPSVTYPELDLRYAFGKDDAPEIFDKVSNLFEQGLRATARTLRRAGTEEINDGVYAALGPSAVVGVRPWLR